MEERIQKEVSDKYSLRGKVFQKLREDIITGKYQHGDELKENAIGEEYGVSRTPVREAFHQLELEGLISLIPNKGAYVDGITAKDVVDIYEIRSRLEGLCASWATKNITHAQLDAMDECCYMSDFHSRRGHFDKVTELDSNFHEIMYEASGSKKLEHILKDFHQYVYNIRKMSVTVQERGRISNEEHRLIAEAIRNGDANQAESLAHQHILNALQNALDNGLRDMVESQKNG
ncbi:MAG: GntR family transcriptional regulator [Lachnospiraceae bacterium]|nr:GntR family transcriptional regulator [Lachnospiraceae bacterium]